MKNEDVNALSTPVSVGYFGKTVGDTLSMGYKNFNSKMSVVIDHEN